MKPNQKLLSCFVFLLLLFLLVLPTANEKQFPLASAQERRDTISKNGLGGIPTVTVFVDFIEKQTIPQQTFLERFFAEDRSISSYFREISYDSLWLEQDDVFHVAIEDSVSHYRWGYAADSIDTDKVKELTLKVFDQVLETDPLANFQDKIVIFVLNVTTDSLGGRGAMCLVPGGTPNPKQTYPENQELFVGYFQESPQDPEIRKACFIDTTFPFDSADEEKGYLNNRWTEFNRPIKRDQFIRGLAIFCNDALLSCAVHDVLHTVKRFSDKIPTGINLGTRARAIPCLYSLGLQSEWLTNPTRAIYCTPYVGWWDNTGDHLHLNAEDRNGFMDGKPYGVSAFTKLRLGVIPEEEIRGDSTFWLVALARPDCPQDALRTVKINLDESGNEYLLLEYRRWVAETADAVNVDHNKLMGYGGTNNPVNPPSYLVAHKGVLIYHVNESDSVRAAGCPIKMPVGQPFPQGCPENPPVFGISANSQFVTSFVVFLYTPSMVSSVPDKIVDYPNWHENTIRRPVDLRDACFFPNQPFKLRRNNEIITVNVKTWNDQVAQVEVKREST